MPEEQRVSVEQQRVAEAAIRANEQRVIDEEPILTIPRITNAPGIMTSCNPTAKRMLKREHLVFIGEPHAITPPAL
jgi:hypothetical protein